MILVKYIFLLGITIRTNREIQSISISLNLTFIQDGLWWVRYFVAVAESLPLSGVVLRVKESWVINHWDVSHYFANDQRIVVTLQLPCVVTLLNDIEASSG